MPTRSGVIKEVPRWPWPGAFGLLRKSAASLFSQSDNVQIEPHKALNVQLTTSFSRRAVQL